MDIRNNEFPVVVQAYDTSESHEVFLAEQVVSNQAEADLFTSRFAGKLIRARPLQDTTYESHATVTMHRKKSSSPVWIFILLIIIALVVLGFTSGWIQNTFGIHI